MKSGLPQPGHLLSPEPYFSLTIGGFKGVGGRVGGVFSETVPRIARDEGGGGGGGGSLSLDI